MPASFVALPSSEVVQLKQCQKGLLIFIGYQSCWTEGSTDGRRQGVNGSEA
jgi:hypothetical protein